MNTLLQIGLGVLMITCAALLVAVVRQWLELWDLRRRARGRRRR